MKNRLLLLIAFAFIFKLEAQTTIVPNDNDSRVITTGMPFLLIASDARSAGMGDMGVATSVDAFSQQWNTSKYAFAETKSGVGVSYTPYLGKLVNDIFLGSLTYYNRIDERSAFAGSLRYFSLGDIEFTDNEFATPYTQRPNEFALDASYSLRLDDRFAMGVAMRYLRSDLKLNDGTSDTTPASTFGVDISGYYQSEEVAYADFNGRWRGGFAIQNIGPKFKYDEGGQENFQPTNLRLGGGFDFIFDDYNKIAVTTEFTKLLVPTPPILGDEYLYDDVNNNGQYDEGVDTLGDLENADVIYKGKSDDVGFLQGMFQSFGDAPGGFREEMKEITWALGAEYTYQDAFAFRAGYFHEAEEKGARQFMALGAGFKASVVNIDLSYLFSTSQVQSPLEGTLRFSLTFNIGAGTYAEY
ncbi:type IX secretion system outer membrane channel protein PorV [Tamlana sp. 2_MG-2023]|uniref:type IX secretion system outer membrane channel protein PorV n=1 Tax=unclassified Tamlana TaxID=2614803 RepID=UPI0026E24147|nr:MULTISPECIES: type IX secretion system outer membrane channel protein PorV [unclassified Tamlana]MDO6760905.1 type IX secretion system outer membrane channel protein PorV [Tamlana sp. 2_MG-2023]MDO6791161.1 type IX secretion system outer membrane channel protein PorV [Tamlana sp. 1_MG-2023]